MDIGEIRRQRRLAAADPRARDAAPRGAHRARRLAAARPLGASAAILGAALASTDPVCSAP